MNLCSEEDRKEVKIGASLVPDVNERLINLLREYKDVFVWSYQDMPGLDIDIMERHFPFKKSMFRFGSQDQRRGLEVD